MLRGTTWESSAGPLTDEMPRFAWGQPNWASDEATRMSLPSAIPQPWARQIPLMAAIIGLDDELIAKACNEAAGEQVVAPVNFNSPGQVVIAGHKEAVDRASVLCKEAGAKRALPLAVSVPSHCSLMIPAADKLAQQLANIEIKTPEIPVVNNVDVIAATDAEAIRGALKRQLFSPVRWTETVQFFAKNNIESLVEVGPGKVLTGLTRRIDKALTCVATNDLAGLEKALA